MIARGSRPAGSRPAAAATAGTSARTARAVLLVAMSSHLITVGMLIDLAGGFSRRGSPLLTAGTGELTYERIGGRYRPADVTAA